MADREWFFHWDNAPVHTAGDVQDWFAANSIQLLSHPPYSPDLAPADFFLFRRVKEELAAWPHLVSGDHQEGLGRGHQKHRQRTLRRRLQELVTAQPEVY